MKYRKLPDVHSHKEVMRMLNKIKIDTYLGLRDRALYGLIYSAGLRASELANLNISDIFNDNIAKVTGKYEKERYVVFDYLTKKWIEKYLKISRPFLSRNKKCPALFLSNSGKRLTRKGIWHNYQRIAKSAGLSTRVHALRHSFATEMLKGGASLVHIKALLGHSSILTTQIYTHLDTTLLKKLHKKYLPKLSDY